MHASENLVLGDVFTLAGSIRQNKSGFVYIEIDEWVIKSPSLQDWQRELIENIQNLNLRLLNGEPIIDEEGHVFSLEGLNAEQKVEALAELFEKMVATKDKAKIIPANTEYVRTLKGLMNGIFQRLMWQPKNRDNGLSL